MRFVPNAETLDPKETWWTLTPDIVTQFLHVLGFANTKVTVHTQQSQFGPLKFFTVVGRRMMEARVSNPGLLSRAARTLRNEGPVEFSRQTVHYLTRAARLQHPPAEKKQINAADGLPIPPPDLIFLAVGRPEADPYLSEWSRRWRRRFGLNSPRTESIWAIARTCSILVAARDVSYATTAR